MIWPYHGLFPDVFYAGFNWCVCEGAFVYFSRLRVSLPIVVLLLLHAS